ncbi:MAG TPA: SH3 domain-containing protein [Pirellulales bacterium]|jgi:uncharacterized protein YgiM (DUF1202 family)
MRLSSGIVLFVCATVAGVLQTAGQVNAADEFPYTAYVNSEDVYVRSGPGKNYYPTDKLPRGEAVEVYRHDPGGWYAVRPPKTSFSWVPADALKPQGDHIAVVEKDHAFCYVGTRFSNAHDVHQVRLDKGEQVEILDVKQIGEGADAQSWCQIAPPSGEFRWVYSKFVDRDPPSNLSRPSDAARPNRKGNVFDQDRAPTAGDAGDNGAQGGSWIPKGTGPTAKTGGSGLTAGRGTDWASGSKTVADGQSQGGTVDPFQNELNNIDLEVSKIVSDDPATWEFTALRRRAEAMLPRAETALERGRVRLVLNRIARFEDVKHRNDLIAGTGSGSNIAIASTRTSLLPVDEQVRYDGVGKLTPVVSQRPNAPQFALVDQSNQVVSFISPAPGVNLQPYIGQQVGITGQRGYMPELRKPYVMAMRVNVLQAGDTGTILR